MSQQFTDEDNLEIEENFLYTQGNLNIDVTRNKQRLVEINLFGLESTKQLQNGDFNKDELDKKDDHRSEGRHKKSLSTIKTRKRVAEAGIDLRTRINDTPPTNQMEIAPLPFYLKEENVNQAIFNDEMKELNKRPPPLNIVDISRVLSSPSSTQGDIYNNEPSIMNPLTNDLENSLSSQSLIENNKAQTNTRYPLRERDEKQLNPFTKHNWLDRRTEVPADKDIKYLEKLKKSYKEPDTNKKKKNNKYADFLPDSDDPDYYSSNEEEEEEDSSRSTVDIIDEDELSDIIPVNEYYTIDEHIENNLNQQNVNVQPDNKVKHTNKPKKKVQNSRKRKPSFSKKDSPNSNVELDEEKEFRFPNFNNNGSFNFDGLNDEVTNISGAEDSFMQVNTKYKRRIIISDGSEAESNNIGTTLNNNGQDNINNVNLVKGKRKLNFLIYFEKAFKDYNYSEIPLFLRLCYRQYQRRNQLNLRLYSYPWNKAIYLDTLPNMPAKRSKFKLVNYYSKREFNFKLNEVINNQKNKNKPRYFGKYTIYRSPYYLRLINKRNNYLYNCTKEQVIKSFKQLKPELKRIVLLRHKNPDLYFYHFNELGFNGILYDNQPIGWDIQERMLFENRLKLYIKYKWPLETAFNNMVKNNTFHNMFSSVLNTNSNTDLSLGWGIFSLAIPTKNGRQCKSFYRRNYLNSEFKIDWDQSYLSACFGFLKHVKSEIYNVWNNPAVKRANFYLPGKKNFNNRRIKLNERKKLMINETPSVQYLSNTPLNTNNNINPISSSNTSIPNSTKKQIVYGRKKLLNKDKKYQLDVNKLEEKKKFNNSIIDKLYNKINDRSNNVNRAQNNVQDKYDDYNLLSLNISTKRRYNNKERKQPNNYNNIKRNRINKNQENSFNFDKENSLPIIEDDTISLSSFKSHITPSITLTTVKSTNSNNTSYSNLTTTLNKVRNVTTFLNTKMNLNNDSYIKSDLLFDLGSFLNNFKLQINSNLNLKWNYNNNIVLVFDFKYNLNSEFKDDNIMSVINRWFNILFVKFSQLFCDVNDNLNKDIEVEEFIMHLKSLFDALRQLLYKIQSNNNKLVQSIQLQLNQLIQFVIKLQKVFLINLFSTNLSHSQYFNTIKISSLLTWFFTLALDWTIRFNTFNSAFGFPVQLSKPLFDIIFAFLSAHYNYQFNFNLDLSLPEDTIFVDSLSFLFNVFIRLHELQSNSEDNNSFWKGVFDSMQLGINFKLQQSNFKEDKGHLLSLEIIWCLILVLSYGLSKGNDNRWLFIIPILKLLNNEQSNSNEIDFNSNVLSHLKGSLKNCKVFNYYILDTFYRIYILCTTYNWYIDLKVLSTLFSMFKNRGYKDYEMNYSEVHIIPKVNKVIHDAFKMLDKQELTFDFINQDNLYDITPENINNNSLSPFNIFLVMVHQFLIQQYNKLKLQENGINKYFNIIRSVSSQLSSIKKLDILDTILLEESTNSLGDTYLNNNLEALKNLLSIKLIIINNIKLNKSSNIKPRFFINMFKNLVNEMDKANILAIKLIFKAYLIALSKLFGNMEQEAFSKEEIMELFGYVKEIMDIVYSRYNKGLKVKNNLQDKEYLKLLKLSILDMYQYIQQCLLKIQKMKHDINFLIESQFNVFVVLKDIVTSLSPYQNDLEIKSSCSELICIFLMYFNDVLKKENNFNNTSFNSNKDVSFNSNNNISFNSNNNISFNSSIINQSGNNVNLNNISFELSDSDSDDLEILKHLDQKEKQYNNSSLNFNQSISTELKNKIKTYFNNNDSFNFTLHTLKSLLLGNCDDDLGFIMDCFVQLYNLNLNFMMFNNLDIFFKNFNIEIVLNSQFPKYNKSVYNSINNLIKLKLKLLRNVEDRFMSVNCIQDLILSWLISLSDSDTRVHCDMLKYIINNLKLLNNNGVNLNLIFRSFITLEHHLKYLDSKKVDYSSLLKDLFVNWCDKVQQLEKDLIFNTQFYMELFNHINCLLNGFYFYYQMYKQTNLIGPMVGFINLINNTIDSIFDILLIHLDINHSKLNMSIDLNRLLFNVMDKLKWFTISEEWVSKTKILNKLANISKVNFEKYEDLKSVLNYTFNNFVLNELEYNEDFVHVLFPRYKQFSKWDNNLSRLRQFFFKMGFNNISNYSKIQKVQFFKFVNDCLINTLEMLNLTNLNVKLFKLFCSSIQVELDTFLLPCLHILLKLEMDVNIIEESDLIIQLILLVKNFSLIYTKFKRGYYEFVYNDSKWFNKLEDLIHIALIQIHYVWIKMILNCPPFLLGLPIVTNTSNTEVLNENGDHNLINNNNHLILLKFENQLKEYKQQYVLYQLNEILIPVNYHRINYDQLMNFTKLILLYMLDVWLITINVNNNIRKDIIEIFELHNKHTNKSYMFYILKHLLSHLETSVKVKLMQFFKMHLSPIWIQDLFDIQELDPTFGVCL